MKKQSYQLKNNGDIYLWNCAPYDVTRSQPHAIIPESDNFEFYATFIDEESMTFKELKEINAIYHIDDFIKRYSVINDNRKPILEVFIESPFFN